MMPETSKHSAIIKILTVLRETSWALFLVCLPLTSFPLFPKVMGGSALVRPLSLYPLLVLLVLATLPNLFTRPVSPTLRTLLPFVLVAIASSVVSTLRGIEPTGNFSVAGRMLRALATLGIGGAIYVTVASLPRSADDLRRTLRWLYLGFVLAMFWGSLQAVYVVHFDQDYFHILNKLQSYLSTRRLFTNRVSGMTYEPNWFAEQLSFLLLPWLLGSVLSGYSAFRWRWRWVTLEGLLLIWAVIVLIFTYSRAGLMNLSVLMITAFLFFLPQRAAHSSPLGWLKRLGVLVLAGTVFIGFVYMAGIKNPFFARLWDYWHQVERTSLTDYLEYLGFGARLTYSEAAYRTYEASPILGVGLGNYAFYFPEMMPDRPLAVTPELLRLLIPEGSRSRLITPKVFYFRLLAETGLAGMAAFAAFLMAVLGCALFLWWAEDPQQKFWGRAGLLGLITFTTSALSFDSFAIPNMWVVFGLITAAAWVYTYPEEGEGIKGE